MSQLFANNASTGLTVAAAPEEAVLAVASGAAFPAPANGDFFLATLIAVDPSGNETAWEIVKVVANESNEWLVQRAQEGTTARLWPAGTRVEARLTAGSLVSRKGASPAEIYFIGGW